MVKALRAFGVLLCVVVVTSAANAEVLSFQCSWDQKAPITITVDTSTMTASSDYGPYRVIGVSKVEVWLLQDRNGQVPGADVQIIERSSANKAPESGGTWANIFINGSRPSEVYSQEGGVCWERGGR